MSVYVDESRHPFGRMVMCHMVGDTEDELHAMADRIGVDRRHFQADGSAPHYDICKAMRVKAVSHGAIELDKRGIVAVIRRLLARRRVGA
jgi:hypothetical protein